MKRIRVVIVDSGIKKSHEIFRNTGITSLEYMNGSINLQNGDNDYYGHGTAIAGIISKYSGIDIIMIGVPQIEKGMDEDTLLSILSYINNLDNIDIVNLSLGISVLENYSGLYEVCDKLSSKGVIIVSAFDNRGSFSYPAVFNNVVGVTIGYCCNRLNDFEYVDDDIINIAAKGTIQRVAWANPDYIMLAGSSFACAHVTVQIARFLSEGLKTREEILLKFKEISINEHAIKRASVNNNMDLTIRQAVIFPFNKEMHSLIRYSGLLPFDIVDVYDIKYSATIGATTSHLMKDNAVKKLTIKNINDIDWTSFDTLILGHTDELSSLINKSNYKKEIVEKARESGKQIYSFDDLSRLGYENSSDLYYPKIDNDNLPPSRFGMLYRISKPVVGVFGTSSKQGKFTLQLKLRELLLQRGYNVGQIGTEPSAVLFGMDHCFPIGYNSSVYIKESDYVTYLNSIINDLCLKNKDIILVGSQSGTVPYDTGNIVQYTLPQLSFLMGTQPDCVVLCVNPFDDIEYIHRTIAFIESSVDCKVIAIVIFPMDIKDNWAGMYGMRKTIDPQKYFEIKQQLFEQFSLPVFRLGDDIDMDNLIEKIEDYFTG